MTPEAIMMDFIMTSGKRDRAPTTVRRKAQSAPHKTDRLDVHRLLLVTDGIRSQP